LAHTAVEAGDEVRAGASSLCAALSVGVALGAVAIGAVAAGPAAIGAVAIGAAAVPLGATAGALGGANAGTLAGGIEVATAPTSPGAFAR
jgi:hypothetical protein